MCKQRQVCAMALALFCAMLPALFYIQSAVGARSEPSKTIVALRKYTVKVHEKVPRCQRKLVVHVGLHKTGTTSIQQFLDNHRTFLAKKMNVIVEIRVKHTAVFRRSFCKCVSSVLLTRPSSLSRQVIF